MMYVHVVKFKMLLFLACLSLITTDVFLSTLDIPLKMCFSKIVYIINDASYANDDHFIMIYD